MFMSWTKRPMALIFSQGHNFIAMFCFATPRSLWIINTKYIHVMASECKYFLLLLQLHLTTSMTMFTCTVLLFMLLFAAHSKKPDHKLLEKPEKYKISQPSPSNSASNEDEEKADVDKSDDYEQVPYKTIKKSDVSYDSELGLLFRQ